MKRFLNLKFGLFAVLAGALLLSACAGQAAAQTATPAEQPHTITVNGNGVAFGEPNQASAQIGVQTRNVDPSQAMAENSQKVTALIARLKELGIQEKDIQTTNFSVYAQSDYDPVTGQPKETITYVVDNTVSITIRDLSKVGDVLGGAVEAGANNVYGVSFGVSDPAALEAQAREKAMADAKTRAEALARIAGVTLDAPLSIAEYSGGVPPIPYARELGGAAFDAAQVPISTGQIQVNLQVSVTYIIH